MVLIPNLTRKACVSEITKEIKSFSILVLTPSPLDYKRQEYLYHNIRPFVRDDLKTLLVQNQHIIKIIIYLIFPHKKDISIIKRVNKIKKP